MVHHDSVFDDFTRAHVQVEFYLWLRTAEPELPLVLTLFFGAPGRHWRGMEARVAGFVADATKSLSVAFVNC